MNHESPSNITGGGNAVRAGAVGLVFSGGVEALAGITLSVAAGEFIAIVGPSGCGKSTLLRLVTGLLAPTSGSIAVLGGAPEDARKSGAISFVFQQPALLPWRNVAQNVRLPLELGSRGGWVSSDSVPELLALVGLSEFAAAYPHELSGGMQMRASLARALATRPRMLLLDEPFGALDDITRQRLNEELLSLWRRDRWTALFVTHNVSEAVFLSQRVLVLSKRPGTIAAEFAVPFAYPRSPELRADGEFAGLCGEISATLREVSA